MKSVYACGNFPPICSVLQALVQSVNVDFLFILYLLHLQIIILVIYSAIHCFIVLIHSRADF